MLPWPTWSNDLEISLGPGFPFYCTVLTPGVSPQFLETLTSCVFTVSSSVICLAPCSGKLPAASVYIEDLILLKDDFGWDLEIDGLSASMLFLQLLARRV